MSNRGGASAKLSPERKYRMREMAVSKLAMAYRLDEVAASVATMQSASALDTVAMLVLQRNPANIDAKYVKFFHEKIPSRMMAEYTPLTPLNEIVANEPGHAQAAVLRTRALTRIFKDDHIGAVNDLTESLAICRLEAGKQKAGRDQLVSIATAREEAEKRRMWTRDWIHENRVAEEDQPRGMEMQLLFQRGNQYLTLACQYVRIALEQFKASQYAEGRAQEDAAESSEAGAPDCKTSVDAEAYKRALEARENIRKHAKRALRDYTTFLSHLDYAHAPANDIADATKADTRAESTADGVDNQQESRSTALVRRERQRDASPQSAHWTTTVVPIVYDIPTLLTPAPPTTLPPFPPIATTSTALTIRSSNPATTILLDDQHQHQETLTYHPLLPETLHSLLLAHALLQTPPTTLFRIANNVARLARLADGYPFFLSARSPARADWAEILRKTSNWVGLSKTWEGLMKMGTQEAGGPSTSSATSTAKSAKKSKPQSKPETNGATTSTGSTSSTTTPLNSVKSNGTSGTPKSNSDVVKEHTNGSANGTDSTHDKTLRDRIHKEAVLEALGDERVVDDDTFQQAVEARERRAWREMKSDNAADVQASVDGVEELPTSARLPDDKIPKSSKSSDRLPNGSAPKDLEYVAEARPDSSKSLQEDGSLADSNGTSHTTTIPSQPDTPPNAGTPPTLLSSSPPAPTTKATSSTPQPQSQAQPQSQTQPPSQTQSQSPTSQPLPKPKQKPKSTAPPVAKDEEYLIGTERASAIAAWILEAPATVDLSVLNGAGVKGGRTRRRKKVVVGGGGGGGE